MSWTDERVETLKTMWSEGKSASQIAKELGGVTRNAVIGKVHRLGLSNRVGGESDGAGHAGQVGTGSPGALRLITVRDALAHPHPPLLRPGHPRSSPGVAVVGDGRGRHRSVPTAAPAPRC